MAVMVPCLLSDRCKVDFRLSYGSIGLRVFRFDLGKIQGNRFGGNRIWCSRRAPRRSRCPCLNAADENVRECHFIVLNGTSSSFANMKHCLGEVFTCGTGQHQLRGCLAQVCGKMQILKANFPGSASATTERNRIGNAPTEGLNLDALRINVVLGFALNSLYFQEVVRGGEKLRGIEQKGCCCCGKNAFFHGLNDWVGYRIRGPLE